MAGRMAFLHTKKVYDMGANRIMSSEETTVRCILEWNLSVPIFIYFKSEKNNSGAKGTQSIFK